MNEQETMSGEIVVIPFPHPGHIFPATELSRHLAGRNYNVTLFLPSTSSPSSLSLHPLIQTVEFFVPHPTRFPHQLLQETIPNLLAQRFHGRDPSVTPPPICAIVDEMINWLIDVCAHLKIPAVSFFTSSASSAAIEHATSNIKPADLRPGQTLTLPGLPDDMAITASDFHHREPPPGAGNRGGGPPRWPGGAHRPRGLAATGGAVALLINTCDDLERPFLDYVAKQAGKPVWGVGPLLPAQFWAAAGPGSAVRDEEVRSKRESSVSERDVLQWLDSKPRGSVIYVSFGTLVAPTDDELVELAAGLEESNRPFIWAVQPETTHHGPAGQSIRADGYSPDELARRAGGRGMVIQGWAPQLLILSHPSTGGYICHCGWNSTVEALGCGVPMLTWPVRGDQFHNAKLVTSRLGAGCAIRGSDGAAVTKGDVVRGIEMLMTSEEIKGRAASVHAVFSDGFPRSSSASVDAFLDFVSADSHKN